MPDSQDPCVFCDIIAGQAPATIVRTWQDAIAIVPLNPVTEGHTLVIPAAHVRDVAENPEVSALTMGAAAELAAEAGPCNVITSRGAEATQTVPHLHLHVVPRRAGDGLALPWAASRVADQMRRDYEDLLGSIWLYIGWRYVTKQLTTEQKNLFADAVEADLRRGDGFEDGEVEAAVDRWWVDAARQAGEDR